MKLGRTPKHSLLPSKTNSKEKEFLALPFLKSELLLTGPVEQQDHGHITHNISGSAEGRRKPVISVSKEVPTSAILLPATGYTIIHVL